MILRNDFFVRVFMFLLFLIGERLGKKIFKCFIIEDCLLKIGCMKYGIKF